MINQPHSAGTLSYRIRMAIPSPRRVLRDNIEKVMLARYGRWSATKFSRDFNVAVGTIQRIGEGETSIGIGILEAVADALKVAPWLLLIPDVDLTSTSGPSLVALSREETELLRLYREMDRDNRPALMARAQTLYEMRDRPGHGVERKRAVS